jgi:RimJ/RimL family protein N-acetyltransferase
VTRTPDFSVKPTITGEKVVLRPFTEDDLPGMLQVLRDPEALKLTGAVHDEAEPASLAGEKRFRDWYASRNDQPDRLDLAVIDRARGGCVGEAVLNEWQPGNHSCSFRIALGPAGRGRGLGTEATRLIVGYGFEQLGMHRISLEVYAFNPRARRVYEKAGFRAEGVLRESLRYGGQWIDATVMSILASEWAGHHGHPSQGTRLADSSSVLTGQSNSSSGRFPVTVTQLPVTRCDICQRTVACRPGTLSEALTGHYRRAHPEALGFPAQ